MGEKVAGNVNLELVAAACWVREMVEKESCSIGDRERTVREEGGNQVWLVSRKLRRREFQEGTGGLSQCSPLKSVFMVRMDRFSRAEETGRLLTMEVKITTARPTGWTLPSGKKKTKKTQGSFRIKKSSYFS